MSLTRFDSGNGPVFLDVAQVVSVSARLQKPGHAPSRCVSLSGGHRVYVTETLENLRILIDSATEVAAMIAVPVEDKSAPKKRGRTPKSKKEAAQ